MDLLKQIFETKTNGLLSFLWRCGKIARSHKWVERSVFSQVFRFIEREQRGAVQFIGVVTSYSSSTKRHWKITLSTEGTDRLHTHEIPMVQRQRMLRPHFHVLLVWTSFQARTLNSCNDIPSVDRALERISGLYTSNVRDLRYIQQCSHSRQNIFTVGRSWSEDVIVRGRNLCNQ